MRVVEQFTRSKNGDPEKNEDALWIGEDFCMVADGVTGKHNILFNGKTGGRIAVEAMISVLEQLSGHETARTVIARMQSDIRRFLDDPAFPEALLPQASVLIYSRNRRELWSVGDCPFILNGVCHKNEKKIDRLLSQLRKATIEALLIDGHTEEELLRHDLSREMILPFLKLLPQLIDSESDFSYSVVDGIHPIRDIRVFPVPEGSELILATDGYPLLKPTLAESEAALAQILENDPLCYRICPSTKGKTMGLNSFDDRTYLKIIT